MLQPIELVRDVYLDDSQSSKILLLMCGGTPPAVPGRAVGVPGTAMFPRRHGRSGVRHQKDALMLYFPYL